MDLAGTGKLFVASLVVAGVFAASCQLVGSGDLPVQNDESGLGANNTTLQAFVAEEGEIWPPPGVLNLWIRGDDFGDPPDYGMDGYLYLVRTSEQCPMTEAGPEVFFKDEVFIVGVVTVRNGSVDQFITIVDAAESRSPRWALMEIGEFSGTGSGHLIHRCGTVTWD